VHYASWPLGHSKIESTVRYLGIEVDDAIETAQKVDIRAPDALIPDMVGGANCLADRVAVDVSY